MNEGKFIVVDGSNGAGKSTVISEIKSHLSTREQASVFTREPGGTPIGEKIREVLLSVDNEGMTDETELLLFAAARAQHVRELIIPSIKSGKVVVSDRFDSATLSFQHYARGISLDAITAANNIAIDGLKPDMTIILDLNPKTGLERVGSRGDALDRMEKEKLDFLHKARNGYLAQAKEDPERFTIIDASQALEAVKQDVLNAVDRILEK